MARPYDVAVVGGSFDGLVAAAYLAKAGKSVVVLEPSERVGGAVGTDEVAVDGGVARFPAGFGTVELLHPDVVRELGLEGHGFERIEGGGVFLPPADGDVAGLHLDPRQGPVAAQIAAHSPADGDAFAEFDRFHRRLAAALAPTLTDLLPDPVPSGLGGVFQLVQLAWRLRRLGADEMPEALRYLPMPLRDALDERFTSDALKAALAAPALTASWLAPRSAGSAYGLLHHRPAWTAGLVTPCAFVRGGPGKLAEAVASAVTAAGGEIRTGAAVERIAVSDRGVEGVMLAGGEEVAAARVASALDPKTTLLGLVDPQWLDPETVRAVERIRGRGSVALVRYVVDRLPAFAGAPGTNGHRTPDSGPGGSPHLHGRIQLAPSLDALERAFDSAKYGRLPDAPWIDLTFPSTLDPSLAPAGRHVVIAWVQYIPRTLREMDWSQARDLLADRVTARIEGAAPGFTAAVAYRDIVTPEDLERRFGLAGGCLYQVDMTLDQLLHLRPVAGWYDHRTPISRLHLCGPACHPGGGVTGLPGRNAARAILRA
jgi:phytoene dehydrogenase-like protein